ncbi:sigma-54-dependent Fis family transcriptional regulator [Paenibacillus sp.]|uniref:sigma-54-dependent Fis family transcriptional regulator n=1 Tax=Paenibacillus sp. TaxID=58172 RepID=UPI002D5E5D9A|nr:sigma-54-dependent Fis family transcriptional regulator [Paenibacillus sp.]HZG86375.1 sigma-54-dependent Fis family transcriptional regulator [Paenibacillus sp.]
MFESALSLYAWQRFVQEGVLDESRMHRRIAESWHRSKEARVNPHLDRGRHVLKGESFALQQRKNELLRDVAAPHIGRIDAIAAEMGMVSLLIDPEGIVLSMRGSEDVLERAKRINFVEGVRWTEAEVGTNAIGTALSIGEPIMVTGPEHYSIASHGWSCASAPIRNDDGHIIGILDVSCPVDRAHPYMLGMVTQAAYAMEREASIRAHRDEMELVQRSIEALEREQPLVVCNPRGIVVAASKPVRRHVPQWAGMREEAIRERGYAYRMEVPICSAAHGGYIGKCVYLLEQEKQTVVSAGFRDAAAQKPFRFLGEAGTSLAFRRTLEELRRVSATDANVFLFGETGTGKEIVARSIHENSGRRNGPFVAVNCGAIPKDLLESELFGYVEGAFTGAKRHGQKGKFEQAHQGTIFLDEIGEIPHGMQVALLRVLQEKRVTPLGGSKEIPLDIRVIAATHRDIRRLVAEGTFREDLFYRLYVFPVEVPALRRRAEDIPHLVRYYCDAHGWDAAFTPACFDALMRHDWPGNVRELMNVLEKLRILAADGQEDIETLLRGLLRTYGEAGPRPQAEPAGAERTEPRRGQPLKLREQIQKQQMLDALQRTNGNVTKAAKLLGMPRSTFYKRMMKFEGEP